MTLSLKSLSSALFVRHCLGCRSESPAPLCHKCLEECQSLEGKGCRRCGAATTLKQPNSCEQCRERLHSLGATRSAWSYDPPFDAVIHALKQAHPYADPESLASMLKPLTHDLELDLLVPVPHSLVKQCLRGHNPAERLARCLSKLTKIPIKTNCLKRKISLSGSQRKKTLQERLDLSQETFRCSQKLGGLRVGLVDDVITTGRTVDICAYHLKEAGALSVTALALCRRQRQVERIE